MPATDQQVQAYADNRVRPRCEQARNLAALMADDRATIDDVYNALNVVDPTWEDQRTDGPPHLLTASDVLAFNTFAEEVGNYIRTHPQYAVVLKACVRPVIG